MKPVRTFFFLLSYALWFPWYADDDAFAVLWCAVFDVPAVL